MKKGRYHEVWSENDTILSFFCCKFGANNLVPSHNEDYSLENVANYYIGSTLTSLKQQMSNIRFIMTNGQEGLACFSKVQQSVYDQYNELSKSDFQNVCLEIIEKIDSQKVYKQYVSTYAKNEMVKTCKKAVQRLSEVNKAQFEKDLSKSPKKLVSIEEYMKSHPNFVRK